MVNLNSNPTRNGKTSANKPLVKQAHTNNLLTDTGVTSEPVAASEPRHPFALVFNERGELRVRSSDGKRWYLIRASRDGHLTCQCTRSLYGQVCYHLQGDPARHAKGAARFLEEFKFAKGSPMQQRFYKLTWGDPLRAAIRKAKRDAAGDDGSGLERIMDYSR